MTNKILTFVSHTHWDREWYQPFEEFRFRLVKLVDKLLHILETDPTYQYFMLDGQTIVLEDYLEIRPEKRDQIEGYVREGRLIIGPFHILPDEFLVCGESTIRNLLLGGQTCREFGQRMTVGYIPDTFGHISQMPQILAGFGFETMVFWRGVTGVKNEFIWAGPDGSEVMVIHLRDSYGNASTMPADEQAFIARTKGIIESLAPTATTPHLLAMNGSDHVEPMPELPKLLAAANAAIPDVEVRHGTLPQFIELVRAAAPTLERRCGEMRNGARAPILPGVLSARMWIKQRNHTCETLLTAWAEPLTAIAMASGTPLPVTGLKGLLKQAWRTLMENHPHDSICGCSVDQVHKEMAVRFDRVEQIGEQVTTVCLQGLAESVDTGNESGAPAVVVFNPSNFPRTGLVSARVPVAKDVERVVLVNENEQVMPTETAVPELDVMWEMTMGAKQFVAMLPMMPQDFDGHNIQETSTSIEGKRLNLEIRVAKGVPPNPEAMQGGPDMLANLIETSELEEVHTLIHRGAVVDCRFMAQQVPGMGYRSFWVRSLVETPAPETDAEENVIENEFLRVEAVADGTLTLTDKRTGLVYAGLNRFVDVGDRGDEYNYCPVESDVIVARAVKPAICQRSHSPIGQSLELSLKYQIPAELGPGRRERSDTFVELPITTRATLMPGVAHVAIETTIQNQAKDHRLRVHFPVPIQVDEFVAEGHFDVISRPLDPPTETTDWVEQPATTHPQRRWGDISDGDTGLMVANRGLPEIEALRRGDRTEIALTLLRSVGWLSRGDMSVRPGPAGPSLPTPEAQCLGTYSYQYALIPHTGGWETAVQEAYAFNVSLRAVVTSAQSGSLPAENSFVTVSPGNLVLSTVKEAENGSGLIVRFWNTSVDNCQAIINFWKKPVTLHRCRLDEQIEEAVTLAPDGSAQVSVGGREIVTLAVQF